MAARPVQLFANETMCCADYDKVELANMNRLFYRPEHAGMTKTDAALRALGRFLTCLQKPSLGIWALKRPCYSPSLRRRIDAQPVSTQT